MTDSNDDFDVSKDDFTKIAGRYDKDKAAIVANEVLLETIKEAGLHPGATGSVFDFGGGTGLFGKNIISEVGSVVVADVSPGMLDLWKEKISAFSTTDSVKAEAWLLQKTDGIELESRVGVFDLVVSMCTICYVPEDKQETVVARLFATAKPGAGIVIVDFPSNKETFSTYLVKAGLVDLKTTDKTTSEGEELTFLIGRAPSSKK